MRLKALPALIFAAAVTAVLFTAALSYGEAPKNSDNGLVTVELKEGDKVTGRITKETRDDIRILYPNETFEAVIPRFNIENIRKPTDEELKGLGRRPSK